MKCNSHDRLQRAFLARHRQLRKTEVNTQIQQVVHPTVLQIKFSSKLYNYNYFQFFLNLIINYSILLLFNHHIVSVSNICYPDLKRIPCALL